MDAPTTHTNGATKAFDPSQGDWIGRMIQSLQEPLPADITLEEYGRHINSIVEHTMEGRAKFLDPWVFRRINRVIAFQGSQREDTLPNGENPNGEALTQPGEEPLVVVLPSPGTTSNQGELAAAADPEVDAPEVNADPEGYHINAQDTPGEHSTSSPETSSNGAHQETTDGDGDETESAFERMQRERREELDSLLKYAFREGPSNYYFINNYFYIKSETEEYEQLSKRELRERLESNGEPFYTRKSNEDYRRRENDKFFEDLFNQIKMVDYAGPLAGYHAGHREYNGTKILVTRDNQTLVHRRSLEEGDWGGLRAIFERMFGAEQIDYWYTWARRVIQAMRSRTPIPIQFFAIGGPPDSGKTWLQEVVIDTLVGGHESPSQFMDGNTPFNSKLFRVPHLMLSDQDGSSG
jgi:hypothetical protein